jgi:hypothetical protein
VGRTVSGRILETDLKTTPATIEVQYTRLVSIADIAAGHVLPTAPAGFVLIPESAEETTMDLVGRRIFHFFELVEGIRALLNSAGAAQKDQVYAAPPLLSELSVASPTTIVVELAQAAHQLLPVAYLSMSIKGALSFIDKRKTWYEGSIAKQQVEQERHNTKQQKKMEDLEMRLKQAEVDMKEAEAGSAKTDAETKRILLERLRQAVPGTELTDERAEAIIENNIQPALRNLAEVGIKEIRSRKSRKSTSPPAAGADP